MKKNTPRMDGTLEQQLLWRIEALREALIEISQLNHPECDIAENAIEVDNMNAKISRSK